MIRRLVIYVLSVILVMGMGYTAVTASDATPLQQFFMRFSPFTLAICLFIIGMAIADGAKNWRKW
jgi:hypothetical protein